MFWLFLAASAAALALIELGALSAWVTVLSLTLQAILIAASVVALFIGVAVVRKRYKRNRWGR